VLTATLITILIRRRQSDPTGLLLWCGVGFCLGIYLFYRGFRLLQRRRLILDTPFSKIRSASMGMVEISGLAVGPYTMVAPLTSRPCYYYRTLVWEWKQSGRSKQWVKVAGESRHVPFFVDDNTGRMLIDPRGAELELHRDFRQEFSDSFFSTKEPVPDTVRIFLARHGVLTNHKIKVEEFCIKPKNALFIMGTLAENPGISVTAEPIADDEVIRSVDRQRLSVFLSAGAGTLPAGSHTYQATLLRPMKASDHQVFAMTFPASDSGDAQNKVAAMLIQSGMSNPSAWPAAGLASSARAVQTGNEMPQTQTAAGVPSVGSSELDGFDPHPPVVLNKGETNKTFIISWRSQQEVARSLGWKCTLMIWGGPLLSLLSLYVFMSIEHLL